jgi:hypothetical protein
VKTTGCVADVRNIVYLSLCEMRTCSIQSVQKTRISVSSSHDRIACIRFRFGSTSTAYTPNL